MLWANRWRPRCYPFFQDRCYFRQLINYRCWWVTKVHVALVFFRSRSGFSVPVELLFTRLSKYLFTFFLANRQFREVWFIFEEEHSQGCSSYSRSWRRPQNQGNGFWSCICCSVLVVLLTRQSEGQCFFFLFSYVCKKSNFVLDVVWPTVTC